MWEQNESFLRYKKKEWLKFGTWMGKSYIEIWNVVAVPSSNLSPFASMYRYRIKPERFFFSPKRIFIQFQHKEQKNTVWKTSCKSLELIWDNGIKYFVKKKNIMRNIMIFEKKYKSTRNNIGIINPYYIMWNIKKKYSPSGIRLLYSKFIISNE